MVKIKSVTVQGFRCFGEEPQTLHLCSDVAVIWGANSQGKTSLGEAIEFLLTGRTVRRELLASASDEFADALRNAHLSPGVDVYVEATVVNDKGETHVIRRTLVADYCKKQECVSTLEINGKAGSEDALASIGVVLSQPPLSAPILTQHTLGYLFSAKPQERANYFKAVLEAEDLEHFRRAVVALEEQLNVEDSAMLKLRKCKDNGLIPVNLPPALAKNPSTAQVTQLIEDATGSLLKKEGQTAKSVPEALTRLTEILKVKRSHTFPLDLLGAKPPQPWAAPAAEWQAIDNFRAILSKVNEESRRLASLFEEVLRLPTVQAAAAPVDCPVCSTKDALTPARLNAIRTKLKETDEFRRLAKDASTSIRRLIQSLEGLLSGMEASCPPFMRLGCTKRREKRFSVTRLKAALGPGSESAIQNLIAKSGRTMRIRARFRSTARLLKTELLKCEGDPTALEEERRFMARFKELSTLRDEWSNAIKDYQDAEASVMEPLKEVVDRASNTAGWSELVELGNDLPGLRRSLLDYVARERVRKELQGTVKAIDKGKERVLEGKFSTLSSEVQQWWELLRPEEATFFSSLQQRPGAKRTIDMKAGLTPQGDRTHACLRDVIAVFSQSQLHCLGLAMFLARVLRENTGFVILDDPFLSSDDEHRVHFIHSAVEKLIKASCQTIVFTQCQRTRKDLENRYAHCKIEAFMIDLDVPADGSKVTKSSDSLASQLNTVKTFVGSGTAEIRKLAGERLRDIAERFCKELVVRERVKKGDKQAMLSDYDGKNLGQLIPEVLPFLTDPSHPGKLNTIRDGLNPAKHDDGIPDRATIKMCFGELVRFRKDYLT